MGHKPRLRALYAGKRVGVDGQAVSGKTVAARYACPVKPPAGLPVEVVGGVGPQPHVEVSVLEPAGVETGHHQRLVGVPVQGGHAEALD